MKKEVKFVFNGLVSILILILFLVFYNYFLLDSSIERIRIALKDVSQAKTLFESESASFLLQDLLVSEIGQPDVNLERLITSDTFQSVFASPKVMRRKADVQFLLQNLLSSYQQNRSPFLQWLDRINQYAFDCFYDAAKFFQYLFTKSGIRKQVVEKVEDTQIEILRRAREFELHWQFAESAKTYQFFIEHYPDYPRMNLVKLFLSSVYLRSGDYANGEKLLSEINLTLASASEIHLVSTFRKKLNDLRELAKKRDLLLSEINRLKNKNVETGTHPEKEKSNVIERLRSEQLGGVQTDLIKMLFQLGVYDLYLFDLKAAKMVFQEILGAKPSVEIEKQATWIQGWIYLLESNYTESRRLMRDLLERFPEDRFGALSSFALATIAERTGNYDEAAREFERLAKSHTSQNASFLFKYRAGGVYLYDLEDLRRAESSFSEAKQFISSPFLSSLYERELIPSIQADLRDSAFQRFFRGDVATARKFFEDVLRLNPDDAWGNCGYGLALYLDGEKKEGIRYVTRCRSLKKDEYTTSALAFVTEKEGKIEDAIALYQEALLERKEYVVALYNLGRLELEKDQLDSALKHFLEAKKQAGRFDQFLPSILNNLGLVYWRMGKTQEAKLEFLNALSHNPNFPDARFNLAQLSQSTGPWDFQKKS